MKLKEAICAVWFNCILLNSFGAVHETYDLKIVRMSEEEFNFNFRLSRETVEIKLKI